MMDIVGKHILVVDDTPENIKLIASILSEKKYTLSFTNNGKDALKIAGQNKPDLILLDIMMPVMNGFEVCEKLKENQDTRNIPVIFMSALSDAVDIVKGFAAGAVDYVTKPIEQEVLLSRIKTHLTIKNLQTDLENQIAERTLELKESRENLRITLHSIGDGVISVDKDLKIKEINPIAEQLTGVSLPDALDQNVEDVLKIYNLSSKEKIGNPAEKVLHEKKIHSFNERVILRSKKDNYYVTINTAPIISKTKEVLGAVLIIHDETAAYEKEQQLVQAQKMEVIGNLAGGLAHDFNNSLTGIFSSVSIIEHRLKQDKEIPKDKLQKYTSIIRQCSEKAANMVSQLLSLSKRQDTAFTVLDINESVKNVVNIAKTTFDKSIIIKTEYFPGEVNIHGDPTQIDQILLNLFINASHAMTTMRESKDQWGGTLLISINRFSVNEENAANNPGSNIGDYWQIRLEDTGVGIPEEILTKVLEPFFTTKQNGNGTGLGLAMSYNIIRDHQGFLSITSKVGIGSIFNLYFPVLSDNRHKEKHEEIEDTENVFNGTVLLIESEIQLGNSIELLLEECGFKIIIAKNGDEGIKIFKEQKNKIKWILISSVLLGMTAKETLLEIKKIKTDINILATSGISDDERSNDLVKLGALDILYKPFDFNKLKKVIRKYTL